MPATCLNNIISIKDTCSDEAPVSTSGFDLFDLAGISVKQAASIADADYAQGMALLKDKRRLAILKVRNDLLAFLQGNEYIAQSVSALFRTGELRRGAQAEVINPLNTGAARGISIYNNRPECSLRKLFISNVYIKSATDGPVVLSIEDGIDVYDFDITLHAGKIDMIEVNVTAATNAVNILLPDSVAVYSVNPNCGCGDKRNDCARVMGLMSSVSTNQEAYGIWADVQCQCDYDHLLCELGKQGLLGEILLYATGVEIMDERLKTDRLNYFTIYGKDEAQGIKNEWMGMYADKWNTLIRSLPGILPNIDKCGCIECGGTKILSNV